MAAVAGRVAVGPDERCRGGDAERAGVEAEFGADRYQGHRVGFGTHAAFGVAFCWVGVGHLGVLSAMRIYEKVERRTYMAFVISTIDIHAVPARWKTDVELEVTCEGFWEAVHLA